MQDLDKKKDFKIYNSSFGIGAIACICCFLWGSATPSIKVGYEWFQIPSDDVASRILFAGVRFTLAGVLAIVLGSIISKKFLVPQRSSLGMICKLGMVQTVLQYIFFYMGVAYTTGVKVSIINGSQTFIAIVIASLIFKYEKLTFQKLLGCIIGFMGVVIINYDPSGLLGGFTFKGEGAVLVAAISYAFSSALVKRYSEKENPVVLSGYQFIFGGVVMSLCGIFMGGQLTVWSVKSVALLIYLAFISAVAYSLWSILLKYNPVGRVAVYSFLNPLFSVMLSCIILKESSSFGWELMVALVLVCSGIYLVNKVKE